MHEQQPHTVITYEALFFRLHLPASTSTLAVPALSSYNFLKSSTLCFLRFNLFGVSIFLSTTPLLLPFTLCGRCSKLGILCNNPGLIVLGFGPGTGKDVDFELGRPVMGFGGGEGVEG
jgi:hypothetical protein